LGPAINLNISNYLRLTSGYFPGVFPPTFCMHSMSPLS